MSAALAARAAALHTCRAPRNDRLATIYRYPAGLHKQTRYHRARATSKHGCRLVTLGDLVPHYLRHNSITTKLSAGR